MPEKLIFRHGHTAVAWLQVKFYGLGNVKYLEMWRCNVLTYLERVFDSPHPEKVLPSMELICATIRQTWVQSAVETHNTLRSACSQDALQYYPLSFFTDLTFEKPLLSQMALLCHFSTTIEPYKPLVSSSLSLCIATGISRNFNSVSIHSFLV